MNKICQNCQYFRLVKVDAPKMPDAPWCSNSKSRYRMQTVKATDTCKWFEKRVEKNDIKRTVAVES